MRLSPMEQNRKHVSRNRNSQIKTSMSSQIPLGIPLEQGFRPQPVWDLGLKLILARSQGAEIEFPMFIAYLHFTSNISF